MTQWEIWKGRPPGFERDHWFVILSSPEFVNSRYPNINALACFSLRGSPKKSDVVLNGSDGFEALTVCQCDFIYILSKSSLHSKIGTVGWERQQAIKAKIKESLRI